MEGVMAEYTVRVMRQDNETTVQLVIHDTEIVRESSAKPLTNTGNDLYLDLYRDTLNRIA